MIPQGFGRQRRHNESHVLLAAVAVLLSIAAHVGCMYYFSDWIMGGAATLRRSVQERFDGGRVPPMRVEMMRADPMRIAEKVQGERDTPSRGPIEAGEKVDELSQSASTVLTVPPPIPREALMPGVPALKEMVADKLDSTPWMPRQEIAQIFDRVVQDEAATLPRRELPMIERVSKAPDIVPSIDLAGRKFGHDPEPPKAIEAADVFDTEISRGTFKIPLPEVADLAAGVDVAVTEERFALKPGEKSEPKADSELQKEVQERIQKQLDEAAASAGGGPLSEEERHARQAQAQIAVLQESVEYVPIDDMLAVGLEIYRAPEEPDKIYFRIGIEPRADRVLQVIAKDIVFVQDVSGSMAEERMAFCRRGLNAALQTLNTGDRFNVVAFRDTFENCFTDWAPATSENIAKATTFVNGMRSFGRTDLFGSMRSVLRMPRDARRPMIAVVVSDGMPTFGITESATIIGEFSAINSGIAAVYMYGIHSKANAYLLDMLAYCNRGSVLIHTGNRWDIPTAFEPLYEGLRNPVMSDISVSFDSASKCEVYPRQTPNLYKGRQLEICGVCAATARELVFQVRGLASDKGYDTIFRLDIGRQAKSGPPALRQRWAQRKIYHLVGEYARGKKRATLEEMRRINTQYGVQIPYESELK